MMDQMELALLYGLSAAWPDGDRVHAVLREADIPLREIQPQELGMPVGALAGLDVADSRPPMVEPFTQSAILFCGLSEQRLREILSRLKNADAGRSSLKAVLTPQNRDWRFVDLLAELMKERDAFARMQRACSRTGPGETAGETK